MIFELCGIKCIKGGVGWGVYYLCRSYIVWWVGLVLCFGFLSYCYYKWSYC